MKDENWRRFIPTDIEPKKTGHTEACEDSDGNVCICKATILGGKSE